jgi:UDP-3-O-[3-hydroxymyristoyl] glucosamine N-acyltransferase
LTNFFKPFEKSDGLISNSAKIGQNTVIQPNVFIGNNVTIGKNCLIHANVSIYDGSIIGDDVIVHSGSVIGSDAFYYKKRPEGYDKLNSGGNVVLKNNVEIGASCTIDKGVSGSTTIGEGTKLDNQVQVGHDTLIGKNCLIAAQCGIAGAVVVEDDVTLWGQVGVISAITIGKGAVVLAQSGIPKSLEGGKTYFGSPVEEARKKMKQLADVKKIPSILEKLKQH